MAKTPNPVRCGRPDSPRAERALGPIRFFALSFGCIVGSGWVVVLGDWLRSCGPLGVVFGMLAGCSVMLANSGAYAELISRFPVAGGEFVFAQRLFGDRAAFFVGWLYALSLIAVVAFEATALPWILETLVPAIKGPTLYTSLDSPVSADSLLIGLSGTTIIAVMNYCGTRKAATLQTALSFAFLVLAVLLVILGFALGSFGNLRPMVLGDHGKPWWVGALWIFATAPLFLNGFQSVAQTVEARAENVTFPRIAASMALALAVSVAFYCLVTLAAASAQPWQTLLDRPMATAAAFGGLTPHHALATLVLVAAALSVARVWNGVSIWAARLLVAQARAGFLPAVFGAVNERDGSPTFSVIFVAICTAAGVALGRGAIIPLVDMASLCLAGNLVLACVAALRARTAAFPETSYRTPGGLGTLGYALVGSAGMALFALIDPLLRRPGHVPVEWVATGAWLCAGILFWNVWRPPSESRTASTNRIAPR
jgi:amino acid transporter